MNTYELVQCLLITTPKNISKIRSLKTSHNVHYGTSSLNIKKALLGKLQEVFKIFKRLLCVYEYTLPTKKTLTT